MFDFSISGLIGGLVFGTWGMYLIRRAKRNASWPSLYFGITLILFPYFIDNPYLLWGIGVGLVILAQRMQ